MSQQYFENEEEDPIIFAQGRQSDRTYASRSFPLVRPGSDDDGSAARFIYKVFDNEEESTLKRSGHEWVVRETPAGRYQIKLLIAREAGHIKDLWVQRVPSSGSAQTLETRLHLDGPEAQRLIELVSAIPLVDPDHGNTVRVNDELIRDLFSSPGPLSALYRSNRGRYRQLIVDDATAQDVLALASRRRVRDHFKRMLEDEEYFDELVTRTGGSPERVWQEFFEENPWILGVSVASQLLTSWSDERLEQIVAGYDVSGPGKRADALMRTVGRIRSMVLIEFKTHRTKLLASEYRSGCYPFSSEIAGGIAQVQGTVHEAVRSIGDRLQDRASDGVDVPEGLTYLIRPRSLLIVGELSELQGASGGHHQEKIRSFELARRSLVEPEILTFDELYARAEFFVEAAIAEDHHDADDDWDGDSWD